MHRSSIRNSFQWHKYCLYYFLRILQFITLPADKLECNLYEGREMEKFFFWFARSYLWLSATGCMIKNSELPLRQVMCNVCWCVCFPFKYSTGCTDKRQIRLCIRFTRALPPCLWTPACFLHSCLKLQKN